MTKITQWQAASFVRFITFCYCDKIKDDEMKAAFNVLGHIRNAYRILVRKSEGRRQCGRCRHRWQDSIKADMH
jgi:hypothetical protein